jgi:hypothetical protein
LIGEALALVFSSLEREELSTRIGRDKPRRPREKDFFQKQKR